MLRPLIRLLQVQGRYFVNENTEHKAYTPLHFMRNAMFEDSPIAMVGQPSATICQLVEKSMRRYSKLVLLSTAPETSSAFLAVEGLSDQNLLLAGMCEELETMVRQY